MLPLKTLALLLLSQLILNARIAAQVITRIAGDGTYGNSGNGGPATAAQLADIFSVCPGPNGELYIACSDFNVVKVVNSAGIISDFAGTTVLGYSGDGGPASQAALYHPFQVYADQAGNVYISDQNANKVRMVNPAGIITTLIGTTPPPPSPALYTGDGGPVSLATIGSVTGISGDQAGNIYLSDGQYNVVRKVTPAGIITTIAGTGTAGYSGDGGSATQAQLNRPHEVAVDNAGNIYIPEEMNGVIRKIDNTGIITTIAGTGVTGITGDGGLATQANLRYPRGVTVDNAGNIYIAETGNYKIRIVDAAGIINTFAGSGNYGYSGDNGPAINAEFGILEQVIFDNAGNLLVVNGSPNNVVRKINNCITALINQHPTPVTLCNTGNAVFTVSVTNSTGLQWQVNNGTGWSNITDNATYSGALTNTLAITGITTAFNNNTYRCAASNACGIVYSTPATLAVTTPVTPQITVNTLTSTVCAGTNVQFFATVTSGGSAPALEWLKNGNSTGSTGNTYSDNALTNGDIISCRLTSNAQCITTTSVISNTISMQVNPLVTPSVSITPSANNICYSTPVQFVATPTYDGTAPIYQWTKNGVNVGTNSPSYADNALNDQDVIICALRSNETCVTQAVVTNLVLMTVKPLITLSAAITATNNKICPGTSVTFNALTNVSGTIGYQWKKNQQPVGLNQDFYMDNNLVNSDIITCTVTSAASCLTTNIANSNAIPITVYHLPVPALDKNPGLCTGSSRQLDAGNFVSYLWHDGSTSRTFTATQTGTYSVTVTDNNGCTASDGVTIKNLLAVPVNFLPADTAVCSYGSLILKPLFTYNNYKWNTGAVSKEINIKNPGPYWLEVTDNNTCTGRDSIMVSPKECLQGFYIPNAFTPDNNGKNDLFKPILPGNVVQYKFTIFNRWGQIVFQTADVYKGWNGEIGGIKQGNSSFVWLCTYRLEGEPTQVKRGTVMLMR